MNRIATRSKTGALRSRRSSRIAFVSIFGTATAGRCCIARARSIRSARDVARSSSTPPLLLLLPLPPPPLALALDDDDDDDDDDDADGAEEETARTALATETT